VPERSQEYINGFFAVADGARCRFGLFQALIPQLRRGPNPLERESSLATPAIAGPYIEPFLRPRISSVASISV
jgi:hypothetical protein